MIINSSPHPVWDLPIRLFHWSLVLLLIAAWISIETGEYDLHGYIGYAILALLIFRIIWGLTGSPHARFSDFIRGPSAIRQYLANPTTAGPGHNPLGGWSVVVMLLLLGFQAVSGLFTTDDLLFTGPLYPLISDDSASWITSLHKANFTLIQLIVGFHIAAILYYRFAKGTNLITAMVKGRHANAGGVAAPKPLWLAAVVAAIAIAIVAAVVAFAPAADSYSSF